MNEIETIERLKSMKDTLNDIIECKQKDLDIQAIDIAIKSIEKLVCFEDLQEQGKLIELPIIIGDIKYAIFNHYASTYISKVKVTAVELNGRGTRIYYQKTYPRNQDIINWYYEEKECRSKLFDTQSEAEKELERVNNEKM